MKTFQEFNEACKDKKYSKKKKGTVEIMPTIKDGEKGIRSMVSKPDNS
jgi:hypothetical protein|tara:strand:- start:2853 stop:2996 length:144 start_codon:yes stop_codon:yes gene_type:complete